MIDPWVERARAVLRKCWVVGGTLPEEDARWLDDEAERETNFDTCCRIAGVHIDWRNEPDWDVRESMLELALQDVEQTERSEDTWGRAGFKKVTSTRDKQCAGVWEGEDDETT